MKKLGIVVAVALLVACSGKKGQTRDQQLDQIKSSSFDDAPEWADKVPNGCGVGSTKFRGNRNMTRDTAVARARTDLARQLETIVQAMIRDYQAQGETDGEDFTEERTSQVSRNITDQSVAGTTVEATHLTNSDPQEFYSLVCINPAAIIEAFDGLDDLNDQARAALKARADAEFGELDKQLKRIRSDASDSQ